MRRVCDWIPAQQRPTAVNMCVCVTERKLTDCVSIRITESLGGGTAAVEVGMCWRVHVPVARNASQRPTE